MPAEGTLFTAMVNHTGEGTALAFEPFSSRDGERFSAPVHEASCNIGSSTGVRTGSRAAVLFPASP